MKIPNYAWVIIPAYNESKHIGNVISKVKKYANNIVVVDDGSTDKTYEIAKSEKVTVLKHIVNLGKGSALKTGCNYAIKNKAKAVVVVDADGQHDPKELPRFIKALKGKDIVFGYRKYTKTMPFIFRFGNSSLNIIIRILYGINLHDTQCGYRAFTAKAYKKIKWKSSDYSMESEMIANSGKADLKYDEVEIETIYSDRYKGTTVMDGLKIGINMLIWRFKR